MIKFPAHVIDYIKSIKGMMSFSVFVIIVYGSITYVFLRDPKWEVASIAVFVMFSIFCVFLVILMWLHTNSNNKKSEMQEGVLVKTFDISNKNENFYEYISESYKKCTGGIYLSGRGFKDMDYYDDNIRPSIKKTQNALKAVLERGLPVVRIQTSTEFSDEWGSWLKELVNNYEKFELYFDIRNPTIVNVAVIDPGSYNSEIQMLFETNSHQGTNEYCKAIFFASLKNNKNLALAVQSEIVERTHVIGQKATPEDIDKCMSTLYFAYGSNTSHEQLIARCPSSKKISNGVLYNWMLSFNVYSQHHDALVAGIQRKEGFNVEGVIYSMSKRDFTNLENIEKGGYKTINVTVNKNDDSKCKAIEAQTFCPKNIYDGDNKTISKEYINIIKIGAKNNGLKSTLEKIGNL